MQDRGSCLCGMQSGKLAAPANHPTGLYLVIQVMTSGELDCWCGKLLKVHFGFTNLEWQMWPHLACR